MLKNSVDSDKTEYHSFAHYLFDLGHSLFFFVVDLCVSIAAILDEIDEEEDFVVHILLWLLPKLKGAFHLCRGKITPRNQLCIF